MDYRTDSPQLLLDFLSYHETIKAHSQRTVDEYYLDMRNFFRYLKQQRDPALAGKALDEIDIRDVDIDFISRITLTDIYSYLTYLSRDRVQHQNSEISNKGLNAASRARKLATIRSFFNYICNKRHLLEDNPCKDVDTPKQMKSLPRYLTLDESISLLESVDRRKVLGIGISAPGPLDCENGRILNPPRFERWHGMDIGKRLSDALGLPAYLEHDVCAMALHQRSTGQSRNFMLLFIDIGIGAAIVSGGELLGNFTGELGHTTIRFDGRLCACGNRGCLETYASIPALLEGSGFRDWFDLVDHADDPEAQKLLNQEAVYLSAGLINLLNLIPVDSIYLAGDICCRHELLIGRLQREIGAKALYRGRNDTRILPVADTPNMGVLSAAEVVFSRFFTV